MREKYEKDYDDFTLREINEEELSGSLSPFTFLVISFILVLIGLMMGYSASYDAAVRAGLKHYQYSLEMVFFGALGIVTGCLLFFTPMKKIEKMGLVVLPISSIVLLVDAILTLVKGHGIMPAGLPELRCADFVVFSFVLFVAWEFPRIKDKERRGWVYILTFLSAFILSTLMLITSGFTYAVMFSLVVFVSFSTSGMEKRYTVVFALFMLTYLAFIVLSSPEHMDMIFSRLMPFSHSGEAAETASACLHAISEGGVLGLGLGSGWYKLGAIKGIEDDYIFALICEEIGLVGAIVIMLLLTAFMVLGVRSARRADKSGQPFIRVATMGFTSMILFKTILHMAVTTGAFPASAITMPFFSISGFEYFITMLILSLLYRFMHITGRRHEKQA